MTFGPVECLGVLAILAAVAIPLLLVSRGVTVVAEGQVAVVESRGRFSRILHAGQHLLKPGLESIRELVPLQEFIYETGPRKLILIGLDQIDINVIVHYQIARYPVVEGKKRWNRIDPDAVYHAVYSSEDWQEATHSAARATMVETFSLLDMRADILDVPNWQDQLCQLLRQRLNEKTRRWGVQVTDIAFSNVEFPASVKENLSAESKLKRESHLRELEAMSLKEIAQTLGLSAGELINWRYVEALREAVKNPQARIVVSPEHFVDGGENSPHPFATGKLSDDAASAS